jgi:hypothetical protein
MGVLGYFLAFPPKYHNVNCQVAKDKFRYYAGGYTLDTFYSDTKKSSSDKLTAIKIVLYAPYCFPTNLVENARTGG